MYYLEAVIRVFVLPVFGIFNILQVLAKLLIFAFPLIASVFCGMNAAAYSFLAFTVVRCAAFGAHHYIFIIKELHAAGGTFFIFKLFVHLIS